MVCRRLANPDVDDTCGEVLISLFLLPFTSLLVASLHNHINFVLKITKFTSLLLFVWSCNTTQFSHVSPKRYNRYAIAVGIPLGFFATRFVPLIPYA